MSGTTPNYHWILPTIGGDASTWGSELNTDIGLIDGQVKANENAIANIKLQVSVSSVDVTTFGSAGAYVNFLNGDTGSTPRWSLYDDAATETGGNAGSNFGLSAYSDAGVYLSTPMQIARATGLITVNYGLNVGGTLNVGGALTVGGAANASSFAVNGSSTLLTNSAVQFASGWTITGGAGAFFFNSPGGQAAELDDGGAFAIGGQAFKPGGGSWANSSDARIKAIERPYTLGLDEVLKLEPIVYRYKGNDAQPGKKSKLEQVLGQTFVGLVAQDVEAIFPGMVTKRDGWVDGQAVPDLRILDTSEIQFALVNSIKTLVARIEVLEAALAAKG